MKPGAKTAAVIGFFDGVHLGHRALLRRLLEVSRERGLTPAVITFDPHPAAVLRPAEAPLLLTTPAQKEALLRVAGVAEVVHLPFDRKLAGLSPREFAHLLVADFDVAWVGIGFNFRFGAGGAGRPETMGKLGNQLGFEVEVLPSQQVAGRVVSSSLIRRVLGAGRVEEAAALLGRFYSVRGTVVKGDGRGRTIGFPTANVDVSPGQLMPRSGVYAVRVVMDDGEWPGAANLGVRPTFIAREPPPAANWASGGSATVLDVTGDACATLQATGVCTQTNPTFGGGERPRLEVHLIGWQGNLYGRDLEVTFRRRLRAEKAFASANELSRQLGEDVKAAKACLGVGDESSGTGG